MVHIWDNWLQGNTESTTVVKSGVFVKKFGVTRKDKHGRNQEILSEMAHVMPKTALSLLHLNRKLDKM